MKERTPATQLEVVKLRQGSQEEEELIRGDKFSLKHFAFEVMGEFLC